MAAPFDNNENASAQQQYAGDCADSMPGRNYTDLSPVLSSRAQPGFLRVLLNDVFRVAITRCVCYRFSASVPHKKAARP